MAEVIIIGAGVVGCSIAYHLAKMGQRGVVVVEKGYIGSGSTERCAGGIRQQFATEVNIRLSMESVRFFERFEEETGRPADFHQEGYLMLATTEEEMDIFRSNVALQRSLGVPAQLLSSREAGVMVPGLNMEDVRGASFCPADGYADPYSVVNGFAGAAKQLGVEILEDTEVTGIDMTGDKVAGVVTRRGRFSAPVVVNAAGPWAGTVGQMAGLNIPVHPFRRHIFVTGPVFSSTPRTANPMVIDFHNGFWFRKEGLSLIFGMRNPDEPEGFDITVDWGFLGNSLAQASCHRLPVLANTGIMRGQAGLHDDSPDSNAILGSAPEIEGFYFAGGFSGHGFMHSPAVGRVMAELITGQKPGIDISSLSLGRFDTKAAQREKCFI